MPIQDDTQAAREFIKVKWWESYGELIVEDEKLVAVIFNDNEQEITELIHKINERFFKKTKISLSVDLIKELSKELFARLLGSFSKNKPVQAP